MADCSTVSGSIEQVAALGQLCWCVLSANILRGRPPSAAQL